VHTATPYSALFLIAFVVAGCTAKKLPGDLGVAELLQRGREFDGKRVAVIGYYEAGLEESCLYPNDQVRTRYNSLIDGVFSPQIWVEPGLRRVSRLKNRYVRVLGTFHYRPEFTRKIEKRDDGREFESVTPEGYGHMGLCPAEITSVTLFRPLR
jgi:hypothetical protein